MSRTSAVSHFFGDACYQQPYASQHSARGNKVNIEASVSLVMVVLNQLIFSQHSISPMEVQGWSTFTRKSLRIL